MLIYVVSGDLHEKAGNLRYCRRWIDRNASFGRRSGDKGSAATTTPAGL
jgi:hypothetical protein